MPSHSCPNPNQKLSCHCMIILAFDYSGAAPTFSLSSQANHASSLPRYFCSSKPHILTTPPLRVTSRQSSLTVTSTPFVHDSGTAANDQTNKVLDSSSPWSRHSSPWMSSRPPATVAILLLSSQSQLMFPKPHQISNKPLLANSTSRRQSLSTMSILVTPKLTKPAR